jgi:hypothetical protein
VCYNEYDQEGGRGEDLETEEEKSGVQWQRVTGRTVGKDRGMRNGNVRTAIKLINRYI